MGMTRQNRGEETDDGGATSYVHVQRNDGIISLPSPSPPSEAILVDFVNATPEEPTTMDDKQKVKHQKAWMEIEVVTMEAQQVDCSECMPSSSSLPLPLSSLTTTPSDSGGLSIPERTRSSLSVLFSTSKDIGRGNKINNDKSSPRELSGVMTKKWRRATVSSWFSASGSTNTSTSSSSPGMVPSRSSSGAIGTENPQEHQQAFSSISPGILLRTRQRVTVSNATATSTGTTSSRWSERSRSASLKIQGLWSWLKDWPKRHKEVKPRRSDDDCSSLTNENIQHAVVLPPRKDDFSDSTPWEE